MGLNYDVTTIKISSLGCSKGQNGDIFIMRHPFIIVAWNYHK